MYRVDLDDEERRLLLEELRSRVFDLRAEIAQTDKASFKDELRRKKEMLLGILRRLEEERAST